MSKSQVNRQRKIHKNDHSQNNDENPSFKQPHNSMQHIKSQHIIEVQSQTLDNRNEFLSVQYKRKLLKLMVLIRVEETGFYNNNASKSIMEEQIASLNHQELMNNSLHLLAQSIFLSIMDILIEGVEKINIPRLQRTFIKSIIEQEYNSIHQRVVPQVQQKAQIVQVVQMEPKKMIKEILCSICYQTSINFCEQKCLHSFCNQCMRGFIKESITGGTYIMNCPQYNCPERISPKTIKTLLNEAQFKRYQYFYDKYLKELNPENKFCTRPDCIQVLKYINNRNVCQKCSVQYCQTCNQIFHEGKPCDFVLMETLQKTYKDYNIKKCPSCQAPIEKESGCNHMHCKKCKHQFCWVCLKKYSHHHYKYYNCFGCPGMQFEEENQLIVQRLKQVIFYLLLPSIIAVAVSLYFVIIPFIMIGNFFYRPLHWIKAEQDFFEYVLIQQLCCLCFKGQNCLCSCIAFIFLWILYQPRALLYAFFYVPFRITAGLCAEFCRNFQ